MFMNNFYLSLTLFTMSCFMFSIFYKHLLMTLISLEFMMINTLFNLYLSIMMLNLNMYNNSFFLTISVCESIIGLSLLIHMIQLTGNDYLKSLSLLKW
uniref:NADH-ubiquinone oxidoreductase chain 4L n=1 Tax=Afrocampsis griseosetosus TaxID=1491719 RepID=A0A0U1WEI1_9HYME|nr:NADH dehydrogenase subunit 4L [Afrocampsis griseosetosus]